ncbi:prepilin peptidase [Candidatus Woesearchaeota archaeon]|nr:prepilin peptidase [Candidatus Woesearchaeota archaeon]
MNIDLLFIPLSVFALAIASYCDVRTREVPDWISYAFLLGVAGIRVLFSFEQGWSVLISGAFGFAVFCLLSLGLYYSRQWGGADAKLLMGMGVVIGLTYPWSIASWDILLYFVLVMVLGAIYGALWMFGLAIKRWKNVKPALFALFESQRVLIVLVLIATVLLMVGSVFVSLLWILVPIPLFLTFFLLFVSVVEKTCFQKSISPLHATEGDWLAFEIKVGTKVVMEPKELQREDLLELQELEKTKKIKHIIIKEGVPFVPSFLIAYVVFLLVKDVSFEALLTFLF